MTQKRVSDLPAGGAPQDSDLMLISRISADAKTSLSIKAGDFKKYLGDAETLGGRPASDYALKTESGAHRIENGWLIRNGDYTRLELDLENVVGKLTLPVSFKEVTGCWPSLKNETSREAWIVTEPGFKSGNSLVTTARMMKHGDLRFVDKCGGWLIVAGYLA